MSVKGIFNMISVVLCTYNGEKYIKEQIESIITQTIQPDEIIICDDNSNDNTIAICEEILRTTNIRFKIFRNLKNLGVKKNFEKGIKCCTGDIVFTCDQDDYWYENKIEKMMPFFRDAECKLVFSNAYLVDKNRKKLNCNLWDSLYFKPENISTYNKCFDLLLKHCIVTGAAMAFRKDIFLDIIPFPDCWIHDGWIAINACIRGKIVAVNENLIDYRQHGNNVIGVSIEKRYKGFSYNKYKWLQRYKVFLERNSKKLDERSKKKLKGCILFWSDLCRIDHVNLIHGLVILLKNLMNLRLFKYGNGIRCIYTEIKNKMMNGCK